MANESPIEAEGDGGASSYATMDKIELEALAIAAIREHRRLIASDEVVYEEWTRANDDPSTSATVLKTLQDEYVERQRRSEAQQSELAAIIDALGFVPEVPGDGELK